MNAASSRAWLLLGLGALGCVTVPTEPPLPELTSNQPNFDCPPIELDPDEVAGVWLAVVDGEPLPKLALPPMSASCRAQTFRPFELMETCLEASPGRVWFAMPKVGTLEFLVETGAFSFMGPDDEKFDVDGYVVDRLFGLQSNVRVPRSTTAQSPRVYVPGFPEHIIDDTRAIAGKDQYMAVFDLRTRKELLAVTPSRPTPETSVAGTEIIRDPASPYGVKFFGGLLFNRMGGVEAFALDERGKLLASTAGALAKVIPSGDELVLASFSGSKLEVVRVSRAGVSRVSVVLEGEPKRRPLGLLLTASKGTVAVGLGSRLIILHPFAEPLQRELPAELIMKEQLEVLAGGRLIIVSASRLSWVIESPSGKVLVDEARSSPVFVRRDGEVTAALLADWRDDPKNPAIVAWGDGRLERGPMGVAQVGRFEVMTYAGHLHPGLECTARLLSAMPELVRFGDWVLPAAAIAAEGR